MSKFKAGTESIECGNRVLRIAEPLYKKLKEQENNMSEEEKDIQKAIIGSQLGLACEYYLKGLIIPNIKIEVPEELEEEVGQLTEEQELMIIVSDIEKIKKDPVLSKLDKRQLRLLSKDSIKNIGHSLIYLLGTKTFEDNKKTFLGKLTRSAIIENMRGNFFEKEYLDSAKGFMEWFELTKPLEGKEHFSKFDKKIEEEIDSVEVSDAFARGRYSIFEDYLPNIDILYKLVYAIREGIKYQYPNVVEVIRDDEETVGRYIYPDSEETIFVYDNSTDSPSREFEIVPDAYFYDGVMGANWAVKIKKGQQVYRKKDKKSFEEIDEDSTFKDTFKRLMDSPSKKIYYNSDSNNLFHIYYVCNGEKKRMDLIDGELVEVIDERSREER